MSIKEEFRDLLEKALFAQQEVGRGRVKEAGEAKKSQQKERGEKDRAVREIDSRLLIGGRLSVFGEKTNPSQSIKRWGPENGEMAYSLIYESGEHHGVSSSGRGDPGISPQEWHKILGVVFDYQAALEIRIKTIGRNKFATSSFNESAFNPLLWSHEAYLYHNLDKHGEESSGDMFWLHSDAHFQVRSKKGIQEFEGALKEFYVGLKTGQGK